MDKKPHRPDKLEISGISLDSNKFFEEFADAQYSLALLEGSQKKLQNSSLLISPLTAKEAAVSSSIEGTKRHYIYTIMDLSAESGRLLKDGDSGKVVLGNGFSKDTNGFDKAIQVGNKISVQGKDFEVIGILKKKGSFIIDNALLMDDTPLRELTNNPDNVDIIAVKIKDKGLMDLAKTDVEKLLRQRRDVKIGEEDFSVSTPQAMLATVNQILGGIQAFIVLIAFASIIVGAIGIVNTMTTSVLERRKEIGIMKAIGARNSNIFLQFFIESGLMGLIGGVIGVFIGLLIGISGTLVINNFIGATAPIKVNFILIFSTLMGGFAIGSIAGIAPAMQAANQRPVEALRG